MLYGEGVLQANARTEADFGGMDSAFLWHTLNCDAEAELFTDLK